MLLFKIEKIIYMYISVANASVIEIGCIGVHVSISLSYSFFAHEEELEAS